MRSWVARGIGLAVLVVGIVAAIRLPVHTIEVGGTPCLKGLGLKCDLGRVIVNHRLPLRFAVAIGAALPLAIILAGRSVSRWMVVAATVVAASGLALAVELPRSDCWAQLVYCPFVDHGWEGFAILVAALGAGLILVAASRVPGSRLAAAIMFLISGIAAALFLPSQLDGVFYTQPGLQGHFPGDHRLGWRIAIAAVSALLALIWGLASGWRHKRGQIALQGSPLASPA